MWYPPNKHRTTWSHLFQEPSPRHVPRLAHQLRDRGSKGGVHRSLRCTHAVPAGSGRHTFTPQVCMCTREHGYVGVRVGVRGGWGKGGLHAHMLMQRMRAPTGGSRPETCIGLSRGAGRHAAAASPRTVSPPRDSGSAQRKSACERRRSDGCRRTEGEGWRTDVHATHI
jgi:hypothetical protein